MTKKELIQAMADKAGVTQDDTAKCLEAFTGVVTETLAKKESIALVGFGTFQTSDRAAREGRNPKTGETIQIAASTVPSFKAGKGLKEAVNK